MKNPEEKGTIHAHKGAEVTSREQARNGCHYLPCVDIVEKTDELLLRADMPGASAESIDIRYENGELTIDGRVKPRRPEGDSFLVEEYGVGDYRRSFTLGEKIDAERIVAEYADGVLTLHLPRVESGKTRKIAVQNKK